MIVKAEMGWCCWVHELDSLAHNLLDNELGLSPGKIDYLGC